MTNLLEGKNAIIYGGGGAIGGGVARTFAAHGATVFLAGRTPEPMAAVAADIAAAGGRCEVATVDALDARAVDDHADAVAARAGSLDISFNLISRGDAQGVPLVDLEPEALLRAITVGVASAHLTARAAARHMVPRGGGVILHLTSGSSRGTAPGMGSTGPADAASEAFMRYLAAELGPSGVRTVGIHTAGVRETLTREKVAAVSGDANADPEMLLAGLAQMTMLRRVPALQQVADTAAFLASDGAGAITSGIVNVTCGLVAG
jgi:NAD(P)-dependent dehydrogenase (short-subunit alcohol dehydrogenase family)